MRIRTLLPHTAGAAADTFFRLRFFAVNPASRGGHMPCVEVFVFYSDFLRDKMLQFGKMNYLCGHESTRGDRPPPKVSRS